MKNHKLFSIASLSVLAISLVGCTPSRELAPPQDGEFVRISIHVPEGLVPHDINVVYRSRTCTENRYSLANGKNFKEDGYQELILTPELSSEQSFHTAEVPIEGGGDCAWRLSNIRFGLEYKSADHFGPDVVKGRSANIVIRYDENNPPTGGNNEKKVHGDLKIEKDFYPWLHERFNGGRRVSINLAGRDGLHMSFYAPNARKIHFEPTIHSEFIISSTEDDQISTGPDPLFTYPDGSTQPERLRRPNFEKLQHIRAAAEQRRHQAESP